VTPEEGGDAGHKRKGGKRGRQSAYRMAMRHPCCGRVSDDLICCPLDPRAVMNEQRSVFSRGPGDWCCWCGENVPEGQSFCGQQCSMSYHEDILESRREKRP
jgi:hypothetical protein